MVMVTPQFAWSGGSGVVTPARSPSQVADEFAAAMLASGVAKPVSNAIAEARSAVAAGVAPIETLRQFRRVREQIDQGWRAYHAVQFDVAANHFAEARETAERLLAVPHGAVLYADATLRLGVVLARQGRGTDARDAIALALALDPDRPISPREFSPETIAVIDAVRAEPRPTHPVMVATEPSGASLTIDGRDVGRAPVTVDLPVGQHVVVARQGQHHSRAVAVAVATATTAIPIALERDDLATQLAAGIGSDASASELQQFVDGVLLYADLDDVVLVAQAVRRGGPALLAQRCAGSPARCTAIVEFDHGDPSGLAAAATAVWQDVRARELRGAPTLFVDPRIQPDRRAPHRCEICRNPYVLAGAGAVLVAGAIAVVAVVTASRPPPVLTIDPSMFSR